MGPVADILILGGTGWLGGALASEAVARGHTVTCLARGESGRAPDGLRFRPVDRRREGAYETVASQDWDEVVDVSWQPGLVRKAVAALGERAAHWTYVSSVSVYRDDTTSPPEDAAVWEPLAAETATWDDYGPAKAACEAFVQNALGERGLIARPGLIAGPGDPTDRFGYWVGRFCLAADQPVLVPLAGGHWSQAIDVRDLAAWLVLAGLSGAAGPVNLVGERTDLGALLQEAADVAGHRGAVVPAADSFLLGHGVEPWSGPRSLPLWIPEPHAGGFGSHPDWRARNLGLHRRPMLETLQDVLVDELARGLDRPRIAGLTRAEERDLISKMS
jgi:nucleoside-diphosphate-sugar epimerase